MAQVFDLVLVYQFIKRLTTPFDETEAFKLGLIDADGKRIKKASSTEEKKAMTYFDRLIFNLKRLLAKIPGGQTKFGTYAAALFLLKECASPKETYTEKELAEALLENMEVLEEGKTFKALFEDAPANATGAAVAGTGDDKVHWRKPDARRKEMKMFLRRYTEQKGKREARKKRKDFMKQLGIDV